MSKTRASSYGRRKNNPFSTSTFRLEGLSQFDWSHTVVYDSDFGDLRPVCCFDLILGTRQFCNLAYVLNMDPLRKPLYSGISVTYDAIYVSDELLGYDSELWFNPASTDEEREANPQPYCNAAALLSTYYNQLGGISFNNDKYSYVYRSFASRPIYNTLYDSFGYPFNSYYYDNIDSVVLKVSGLGAANFGLSVSSLLDPFSEFYTARLDGENPIAPFGDLLSAQGSLVAGNLNVSSFTYKNPSEGVLTSDSSNNYFPSASAAVANVFGGVVSSAGYSSVVSRSVSGSTGQVIPIFDYWSWLVRNSMLFSAPGVPELDESSPFTGSWLSGSQTNLATWLQEGLENFGFVLGGKSGSEITLSDVDIDSLARYCGFSSYQESLDAYRSYLYSNLFFFVANELVDLRPIFAYRRAYNDLYVNTNLWDCDNYSDASIDFYYNVFSYSVNRLSSFFSVVDYGAATPPGISFRPDPNNSFSLNSPFAVFDLQFMRRWWSNDMFTSAVPADMSAAANAVEIPSSGVTLVDLRNLNIEQEVQERLNYAGQRVTDTTFAFFGFKSPELRYRYARHISRIVDNPRIDNVLQNSESATTPQATPAGYGYGSKAARFYDFQMPWYGFILILSSVMTEPVYKDAVPRMILKKEYEDFIFPPYQEISDISVSKEEIQAGAGDEVFGYQRSYYYMMRQNHKVSGTMRLRQKEEWITARDFRDGFVLNSDFAMPNSSDRLNRIFADQSDGINHFNFEVGLSVQTVLPLKRDIHYHL